MSEVEVSFQGFLGTPSDVSSGSLTFEVGDALEDILDLLTGWGTVCVWSGGGTTRDVVDPLPEFEEVGTLQQVPITPRV